MSRLRSWSGVGCAVGEGLLAFVCYDPRLTTAARRSKLAVTAPGAR